jgi:hypothetical protein
MAHHTTPLQNYLIAAPIVFTTTYRFTCELQNATITLIDNGVTLSMAIIYQWYNLG